MSRHIISVIVENQHGALSRIAGLFSSRGYNISSLTVAETDDPSVSRMTIVVAGDESILEQVVKQLNRLVDVIKVLDFTGGDALEREMLLVRLDATKSTRGEILMLVQSLDGTVVSVTPGSITVELYGTRDHIDEYITVLKPYGMKDLVRSGSVAIGLQRK